ncbi:MAG: tungsten ABC transporter ATP-binding protein [Desulfobacterales bacterium RIFOXYA12_FULL_46_15]|nr:MAG: tungsten ABC transporter ATP-binding protein [Desulfobacterales bacterium RIFOXYA12_FULL_46_15]
MTHTNPAYHLKNIRHYYGSQKVLDIDDLNIKTGSITGLIGSNGSGKSTLLKMLAFALKPAKGQIFYKGREESGFSPTVRLKVTLLTQNPYLLKRSVFENIIYGLKIRKDTNHLEARVKTVLSTVGLDYGSFAHRRWHQLSGGEAQRVALAARLILKPEVLLLDEPIASVDTKSAGLIRKASLKARDDWGTTLVIASHDLQWLYSITENQISIFNGKIFPGGIETIITGPFEKTGDKAFVKKHANGQPLILKAPGPNEENAVIRKKDILIEPSGHDLTKGINRLSGHVAAMHLEKETHHIVATVLVHDLSFVLKLTPDQAGSFGLYPGKNITLGFYPGDVEWF